MAEWPKAAVLKTAVPQGTGGSNPSFSAILKKRRPHFTHGFFLTVVSDDFFLLGPGLSPNNVFTYSYNFFRAIFRT